MGDLHNLVRDLGNEEAKELARALGSEKRLVDVAAKILQEEGTALGFTYSGFAMTSLPHKRLKDDQLWERKGGRFSLLVEPGHLQLDSKLRQIGVPYGSRARLILLYLQSEALKNDSPEVELGRSLAAWIDRMGIPIGGKSYQQVRDQTNRIAACRMTFFWEDEARSGFRRRNIIDERDTARAGDMTRVLDRRQGRLWEDKVLLSAVFFKALKDHPVPIWEPAIRQIANQSLAIDIYIWLAYRLRSLREETPVSWGALFAQFGAGYQTMKAFRPRFAASLQMALQVYEDARVQTIPAQGVILRPSRPPVGENRVVAPGWRPIEPR